MEEKGQQEVVEQVKQGADGEAGGVFVEARRCQQK